MSRQQTHLSRLSTEVLEFGDASVKLQNSFQPIVTLRGSYEPIIVTLGDNLESLAGDWHYILNKLKALKLLEGKLQYYFQFIERKQENKKIARF